MAFRVQFCLASLFVAGILVFANESQAVEPPDFVNDIQPLLQKNCVACHNLQKAEGGLNLENLDVLLKGGDSGAALQTGKSAESSLVRRVKGEEEVMPPADNKVGAKAFTPEEIALLSAWIDGGAAAGSKKNATKMEWQKIPDSVRPIYAIDATADGQFTVLGRGNQAVVYHWAALGSSEPFVLVDPSLVAPAPHGAAPSTPNNSTHLDLVQSVAIDRTGNRIATGGFRDVKIWRRADQAIADAMAANLRGSVTLAASPVDKWIAKATRAPSLEIVDTESLQTVARWDAPASIRSIDWTSDGKKVVVLLEDSHVALLPIADVVAQKTKSVAPEHLQKTDVSASQIVATIGNGFLLHTTDGQFQSWQWNGASESERGWIKTELGKEIAQLVSIDFAAPDRVLAATQDGSAHLYSVSQAKLERTIPHGSAISHAMLSSDGNTLVTVGTDGVAKGWNAADGKALWENRLDLESQRAIEESETRFTRFKAKVDRAASQVPELEKSQKAEADNVAKLQKTKSEIQEALTKKAAEFDAQTKQVTEGEAAVQATTAALEEAKKKLEQSQKDLEARKANLAKAEAAKKEENAKLENLDKTLAAADQSAAKAAATLASFQKQLETDKAELATLEKSAQDVKGSKPPIPVSQAAITPDGKTCVTVRTNGSLHAFRVDRGTNQSTMAGNLVPPAALALTVDGQALAVHEDGRSIHWGLANRWSLEKTIGTAEESPFSDRVTALDFSHDGKLLVVGSGPPSRFGDLKLLDVETSTIRKDWGQVHSDTIFVAKFSPDGQKVATGGADKLVRLHAVNAESAPRTLEGHTHHVLGLAWQDDGFLLASSSADNTVKIWDVELGQAQRTIAGFGKEVTALSFVGRSTQILSSSADQQVRLHNAADGKLIRAIGGPADALYSLTAITPDVANTKTAMVAAGGQDGMLWVWQVEDGKAIQQIK
ncbi:Chromosome partition protein Smc [Pirellula sp. SH-Sr6A]|uniref:WD40 domain-containing protein n=1 Tax=Pirellula sp. SH-Sr6A TaxID=1632865 RepID=UPI00078C998E|nr:c-type cytochrome domain-containing protein [Pirellula sp. SH-Sr6A]AMV34410.1 Chromosome partition protein Smc [Pirellula sp. SH-Sr6A]